MEDGELEDHGDHQPEGQRELRCPPGRPKPSRPRQLHLSADDDEREAPEHRAGRDDHRPAGEMRREPLRGQVQDGQTDEWCEEELGAAAVRGQQDDGSQTDDGEQRGHAADQQDDLENYQRGTAFLPSLDIGHGVVDDTRLVRLGPQHKAGPPTARGRSGPIPGRTKSDRAIEEYGGGQGRRAAPRRLGRGCTGPRSADPGSVPENGEPKGYSVAVRPRKCRWSAHFQEQGNCHLSMKLL